MSDIGNHLGRIGWVQCRRVPPHCRDGALTIL
jgi:hypothetical protein